MVDSPHMQVPPKKLIYDRDSDTYRYGYESQLANHPVVSAVKKVFTYVGYVFAGILWIVFFIFAFLFVKDLLT